MSVSIDVRKVKHPVCSAVLLQHQPIVFSSHTTPSADRRNSPQFRNKERRDSTTREDNSETIGETNGGSRNKHKAAGSRFLTSLVLPFGSAHAQAQPTVRDSQHILIWPRNQPSTLPASRRRTPRTTNTCPVWMIRRKKETSSTFFLRQRRRTRQCITAALQTKLLCLFMLTVRLGG